MERRQENSIWYKFHIDLPLLLGILSLMSVSSIIMYSAGGQDIQLMLRQIMRFSFGLATMFFLAQLSPNFYARWAMPLYLVGVGLLVAVLLFGHVGKGAQRWINLGFFMFQPSEIMKLAMPLMVAAYIGNKSLPPSLKHVFVTCLIIFTPTILISKQPDLGTSILVAASGVFALFLAGVSWKLISFAVASGAAFAPVLWFFLMHNYQRQRVLTFLDPESDPLGTGYHIIQSKIAIGSGGVSGKGWMQGTQSQLDFLPERHTDFIFAVFSEEFGLVGITLLLAIYLFIICRGLYIATQAQSAFSRLAGGALILTFFVYVFVNIGMVSGLLPVVGVPLPLISYGGTSMVTLMAGFGILMSIHTHKRLLAN